MKTEFFFWPGDNIGDDGVEALCEALKTNTSLTEMNLCGNARNNEKITKKQK